MRVALVSPYSWTYPGGVTRHIEALAAELLGRGPRGARVRAVRPRHAARPRSLHRGARPQAREAPDWLVPLGGTIGWPSNGAVSNLALTPVRGLDAAPRAARLRARRRAPARAGRAGRRLGRADEHRRPARRHLPLLLGVGPAAPDRRAAWARAASSTACNLRLAVSEAAAWTGRRFYGGHYRVIPNGVALPAGGVPAAARAAPRASRCGSCSSARPSSARACRCCCAPSRRCAPRCPPS